MNKHEDFITVSMIGTIDKSFRYDISKMEAGPKALIGALCKNNKDGSQDDIIMKTLDAYPCEDVSKDDYAYGYKLDKVLAVDINSIELPECPYLCTTDGVKNKFNENSHYAITGAELNKLGVKPSDSKVDPELNRLIMWQDLQSVENLIVERYPKYDEFNLDDKTDFINSLVDEVAESRDYNTVVMMACEVLFREREDELVKK
ncbi:MAG: hypothetical protein ACRCX2_38975 [Paraclostridium sp.]